jgi:hypothetical protein
VETLVPSFVGWQTYRRVLTNLLVFGLVALGGEWLVHQLEYLIEYGQRYGTVMESTPHRFYMAPLGAALAAAAIGLLLLAVLTLILARIQHRRLLLRLPDRVVRHLPSCSLPLPVRSIAQTGLVLALCQAGLYLLQENLETVAVAQVWPGLGVVLAPQHATVLPLHVLVAACGSVLLWLVAARIGRSHRAVQVAQILVTLLTPRQNAPPRLVPARSRVPNLRLIAGILCLRSPPLSQPAAWS